MLVGGAVVGTAELDEVVAALACSAAMKLPNDVPSDDGGVDALDLLRGGQNRRGPDHGGVLAHQTLLIRVLVLDHVGALRRPGRVLTRTTLPPTNNKRRDGQVREVGVAGRVDDAEAGVPVRRRHRPGDHLRHEQARGAAIGRQQVEALRIADGVEHGLHGDRPDGVAAAGHRGQEAGDRRRRQGRRRGRHRRRRPVATAKRRRCHGVRRRRGGDHMRFGHQRFPDGDDARQARELALVRPGGGEEMGGAGGVEPDRPGRGRQPPAVRSHRRRAPARRG